MFNLRQKNQDFLFSDDLNFIDPDVNSFINLEEERQERKIIMIASESICPKPVREVIGSVFTNIYAEGYPSLRMTGEEKEELMDYRRQIPIYQRFYDRRYYKGCDYVDFVEALAMLRIAKLFETDKIKGHKIFANVQPLSGAAANSAVYSAFLKPGDTIMGMDLSHGGHLTHGSPVNRSGKFYNVIHYTVDSKTGKLNYDEIEKLAKKYNPKIIIAGYSAYPWDIDWPRFKEIAMNTPDRALLLADIAHIVGPIVGGKCSNPIEHADIISFTTHKTLCGPRGAVILSTNREIAKKINNAVFPGEQGGPHINNIAAKAVAFKLAATDEFRLLQEKIIENSAHLAGAFQKLGLKLAYGGTNTHMSLIDLKSLKKGKYELDGETASRLLDICGIVCNKNTIAGDDKAARPSAIRFGTTWITQRGMGKEEMEKIASMIHTVLTEIRPFRYLWPGGYVGRGKIEQPVMDRVKEEVDILASEFPGGQKIIKRRYPFFDLTYQTDQESPLLGEHKLIEANIEEYHGYQMPLNYINREEELRTAEEDTILFDMSDLGIIEIYGERAKAFLQESTTNNIYALKADESQRGFLFDHNYNLIDDLLIMRINTDEANRDKFLILSNTPNHLKVKRWFRNLALGYSLFDKEELYGKIQGPVIVDDHRQSMIVIGLYGQKTTEVIKKLFPGIKELKSGELVEHDLEDYRVIISNISYGYASEYQLIVPRKKAIEVWRKIKSLGVKAAGTFVRDKLREKTGLPLYKEGDRPYILDIYEKNPSLFHLAKPHFTGQKVIINNVKDTLKSDKSEFKYEEKDGELKRTPLIEEHRKRASKSSIVPFAGWEMPVKYTGIKEEHMAVRECAGMFDVAHMGVFDFKGEDAGRFLDLVSANYVPRLIKGQAVYSYLLDQNGIPIDDILIYGIEPPVHYMVVVNAANADKDWEWLKAVKEKRVIIDKDNPLAEVDVDVEMRNLKDPSSGKDQRMDLALQGPRSLDILKTIIKDEDLIWELENLKKFYFARGEVLGMDLIIARTGYTGEEVGFEIYVHPDNLVKLWNILLENGEKFGLKPTALGSRDSTRTEAGLPLYGHELAGKHGITPVEAGYGSFVKFHKNFFIGRKASIDIEENRKMEIVRFKMSSRGIKMVKPGNPVTSKRGEYIGEVTSCAVGTDDYQVGLAYIDKKYAKIGDKIGIFVLPPKVQEKQKDHLSVGDKLILHETGEIITRFPVAGQAEVTACEE